MLLLLLCSVFAFAVDIRLTEDPYFAGVATLKPVQELTKEVAESMTKNALNAFSSFVSLANGAINSIKTDRGLKTYGERLTLSLTGIVVLWSLLKNIALKQSLPQLIGDLVFPLIIASFVIGAGIAKLPDIIESSTTTIAGLFGSSGTSSLETNLASNMLNAASKVWGADKADAGILSFAASPLTSVAMLLLRILVVLLMLGSLGLGVAAILVAKFQMALAIALAPLLIPWIVFKPTEFLFSGWLNFFLKAGFGLVGIFAVSAVVLKGSDAMAAMITTTNSDMAGVMTFGVMAGMSLIFAYLMLKGADIGEGIIGGSATGIGQLSSVMKGGAMGATGRMTGATTGAMGSAAKIGGAQAAGKIAGNMGATGKLSEAGRHVSQAAFGSGSAARATFERARAGAVPAPSAASAPPPPPRRRLAQPQSRT